MKLADIVLKENPLVAAPLVACKLTALLKTSPHHDEIIKVISHDSALTLKILKLCNTAYFSRGESLSSLERALDRLGSETILRLVWQIGVGDRFQERLTLYGIEAGLLWRHSVTTAIAAEELRLKTESVCEDKSTCFTAGLLHDFGKLIINHCLPDSEKLKTYCLGEKLSVREAEKRLFDCDHAQLGGELLEQWHLAPALVYAVADHHKPAEEKRTPLSRLICLADACAHLCGAAYGWGAIGSDVSQQDFDLLKMKPSHLEETLLQIQKRSDEIESFMFSLPVGAP